MSLITKDGKVDKDKLADKAPPENKSVSRYKFLWIILAIVVLGFIAKIFIFDNGFNDDETAASHAPRPPVASMPPPPAPARSVKRPLRQLEANQQSITEKKPNIIYNPPKKMTVGTPERIEVRISNKQISQEVFEEGLKGEGEIQSQTIKTGGFMSVQLCCGDSDDDEAFDITPLNSIKQRVGFSDFTHWAFKVIPRKGGEQDLELMVSIIDYDNFGNELPPYSIPVMTEIINIDVDPVVELKTILKQHWYWLALLILIPVLVVYVTRTLKGKKTKSVSGNESVFLSYRRNDSSGYTLAVYQKLKGQLGVDKVFMDMDDIPHGVDFSEHLDKVLSNASTVLVMIGDSWLNATNASGRRLDNPGDFVRMEIATALERDIRVIPVLLNGAEMPTAQELPKVLQGLSRRNAIRIYDDQFEASIERLVESIG